MVYHQKKKTRVPVKSVVLLRLLSDIVIQRYKGRKKKLHCHVGNNAHGT